MLSRRDFLKVSAFAGAGLMVPFYARRTSGAPADVGLSDPALQPKFVEMAPNALHPSFKFKPKGGKNTYQVGMYQINQNTGLIDPVTNTPLTTPVWGYGYDDARGASWPGRTFEVKSGPDTTTVMWANNLPNAHLLPVDTNLHWCYALPGYDYSIVDNGVPAIPHLHGGHTDFQYDGNPEFFFNPGATIFGPQWADNGLNGFTNSFIYDNNVPAGTLWYHDHALGITRLNVYAGLAGFYIVRDQFDTGRPGNPLGLPAFPYELAYAIQDRMFRDTGELFYPAFPGDPAYNDFITGEEDVVLPPDLFPDGGPTALAEFFGDHMVVNGKIWPKENVEPRNYRMRLLNGTDSRFLAIQFFEVPAGATDFTTATGPLPFTVIGSDQGLASSPSNVDTMLFEPGSRYDVIFDFKTVTMGNRVIMKNIAGDEPFGGDIPGPQIFGETDRILAFDVVVPLDTTIPDASPTGINFGPTVGARDRLRKVALFEGRDEFGRLQPLLGTAEPAKNYLSTDINWPDMPVYSEATLPDGTPSPLIGPMEGSIAWHSPTTENPALNTTEEWEVWNVTADAHPIHLHLVHFKIIGRQEINFDSNVDDDGLIPDGVTPADDGIYLVRQPTVQHNSVAGDPATYGIGFKIVYPTNPADAYGPVVSHPTGYVENTPKDMVTALPGQITRIKATFDKPGRYVWHCHILSHEDHEMMRVLHVGAPAAMPQVAQNASAEELQVGPDEFAMGKNYPNPFKEATSIRYQLPADSRVSVEVYDVSGRKVKTLVAEVQKADRYLLEWNGLSDTGNPVSPGVYIYKMNAKAVANGKAFSAMEKMVKSW